MERERQGTLGRGTQRKIASSAAVVREKHWLDWDGSG